MWWDFSAWTKYKNIQWIFSLSFSSHHRACVCASNSSSWILCWNASNIFKWIFHFILFQSQFRSFSVHRTEKFLSVLTQHGRRRQQQGSKYAATNEMNYWFLSFQAFDNTEHECWCTDFTSFHWYNIRFFSTIYSVCARFFFGRVSSSTFDSDANKMGRILFFFFVALSLLIMVDVWLCSGFRC